MQLDVFYEDLKVYMYGNFYVKILAHENISTLLTFLYPYNLYT